MSVTGTYQDFNLEMFNDNLQHDLQQEASVLMNIVTMENVAGRRTHFHKYGKMTGSVIKTERGQDRVYDEASFERRYFDPKFIEHSTVIDEMDRLHMVKNYKSAAQEAIAMELGRQLDIVIMDAIKGSANVVASGTTTATALPSASKITVNDHSFSDVSGSNDICLTPAKLKNALKKLMANHVRVDTADIFVVAPANQLMRLATFDEVINADKRSKKPLDIPGLWPGLQGYMGLNFIHYEPLDALVDGSSDELVYVLTKDAVKLGMLEGIKSDLFNDYRKVGSPEAIASYFEAGAVRMFEEKVIEIACDPTTNIPA